MTSICLLHAETDGALAAGLARELRLAQVRVVEFSPANLRACGACVLLWTRGSVSELQPMSAAAAALYLGKPCLVVTPFGVRAPPLPGYLQRCARLEAELRFLPEAIAQWLDQLRSRPLIHVPVQEVLLARLARLGERAIVLRERLAPRRPTLEVVEPETDAAFAPEPALLCQECGSAVRDLRRHVKAAHGLSSEAYRAKFGLPPDTPLGAERRRRR